MATSTTNYQFRKPATTDVVNVTTDISDNMDDIDTELKRVDDYTNSKPLAHLRQETAQSIPDSTWTSITFAVEDIDTHSGHDNVTNPSRYTSQKAGYYRLDGGNWFAANATGVRFNRWAKNGTVIENSGNEFPVTPGGALWGAPAKSTLVSLGVGDYVELQCWQNSGGALNTATAASPSETGATMSVEWLRPL